MDLQAEKIELIRLLVETESQEIISELKSVFRNNDYDFYDDLPKEVKESIERGIKDADEGRVRDHEIVMGEFKTKYGIND